MLKVWFNLHKRVWSTKTGKAPVQHLAAVRLLDARFVVSEAARRKVIAQRCRSVHAHAIGTAAPVADQAEGIQVSYNPYRGPSFYRKDTGAPVWAADELHFMADGRVLAINPRDA